MRVYLGEGDVSHVKMLSIHVATYIGILATCSDPHLKEYIFIRSS